MSDLSLVSRNPHAACDSGSPCETCKRKYAPAEQAARDRHPAGSDLPAPLDYEVKEDGNGRFVRVHVTTGHVDLDESMLAELTARLTNPEPCDRDVCQEPAEDGGLCAAHRDAADALPSGGWRR